MTFEALQTDRCVRCAVDLIYEALLKAWLTKKEIAAIDLDKPLGQAGAQGLVANWTVTFGQQKEVQGVVITNVTMKLSSFPITSVPAARRRRTSTRFHNGSECFLTP